MSWYDAFSTVYDLSVERVYQPYRDQIVDELQLQAGGRVLDLACGTGPNLARLRAAVGPTGAVFGLEPSAGMIDKARAKVGGAATFLQMTAMDDSLHDMVGGAASLDGILVTLGLSVIPTPEANVAALVPLLRPGARFVAFDIQVEQWVPTTWWVQRIARADVSRSPAKILSSAGLSVVERRLPGSPWIHGGHPVLVTGTA